MATHAACSCLRGLKMLMWSCVCKINVPRATLQGSNPPSLPSNTSDTDILGGMLPLDSHQARGSGEDGVVQSCAKSRADSSGVQILTLQCPENFQRTVSFIPMSVPPQRQHILPRDLALAAANIYRGRRKKTTTRKQKPSYAAEGE